MTLHFLLYTELQKRMHLDLQGVHFARFFLPDQLQWDPPRLFFNQELGA